MCTCVGNITVHFNMALFGKTNDAYFVKQVSSTVGICLCSGREAAPSGGSKQRPQTRCISALLNHPQQGTCRRTAVKKHLLGVRRGLLAACGTRLMARLK